VGAEALAHLDPGDEAIPAVRAVRNPLPARGGVDPETIEEVRQLAPEAFRARMLRAVTEADYAEAALRLPEVSGAVATFRWTGSWHTVFVAVDPRDRRDLVTGAGGILRLAPAFERSVRAALGRVRLAGYDLELRPPRFVPLDVEVEVCAAPGHFRADVRAAVVEALSAALLPDGRRGFFHPDEFTFGTPVHLSRLYAAIERVEGVDAALVRRFQRYGRTAAGELDSGTIEVGPWEVAQLENDPSFVERGVLQVTARGGKA
jgi:predicted phage baseplate assembly protein